jgi:hypothetical protein
MQGIACPPGLHEALKSRVPGRSLVYFTGNNVYPKSNLFETIVARAEQWIFRLHIGE